MIIAQTEYGATNPITTTIKATAIIFFLLVCRDSLLVAISIKPPNVTRTPTTKAKEPQFFIHVAV
jgi:hypothetical protein